MQKQSEDKPKLNIKKRPVGLDCMIVEVWILIYEVRVGSLNTLLPNLN